MSEVFRDPVVGWAAALVVVLPLLIIGIGEAEERLRQRESSLQHPVGIIRTWVLPLFAAWALIRVLFDQAARSPFTQMVASALVVSVGVAALAALALVVDNIKKRPSDGGRSVPRLVLAFPRIVLIIAVGWILVDGIWRIDLSSAMTALGVTSLVVSLALQDTLGGIASGFTLLADQPFQPGDWIEADGVEGRVLDTNWRSSRIETRNGDLVAVPNGQLARATITNFDEPTRFHRIDFPVQVAFVHSPTSAKEMLLAAASSTPGVLADPAPNVLVLQVDDPLMTYQAQLWVDDYSIVPQVKSDFGSLVWYHSHRHGVGLPSPAQDLYLWDGQKASLSERRDRASILRGLRASPLLDQLDDDELDELANAAIDARFAAGETILDPGSDDLVLVERGAAQLSFDVGGSRTVVVMDLTTGDLAASLDPSTTTGRQVHLVATTDCDVITLRSDLVVGVISRSPSLNTALDQIQASRSRRLQRVLKRLEREAEPIARSDGSGDRRGTTTDDEPRPSEGDGGTR